MARWPALVSRRDLDEDSTVYLDNARDADSRQDDSGHDATIFANAEEHRTDDVVSTDDVSGDSSGSATQDGVDRTQHALQAMEIGVVFRHRFQTVTFGIQPRWRIRMTTPDGMTTEGGTRVRQSLVLYKEGTPTVGTFTVGHVDSKESQAALKTFAVMGHAYEARYGVEFEMVESEYERLLDEVRKFTSGLGYQVRMLTIDDAATPGAPAKRKRKSKKKKEARQLTARAAVGTLLLILVVGVLIGYALGR